MTGTVHRPMELTDPQTLGVLFESLVVRDLRIYGQAHRSEVFHYRDDTGLEADAVIERDDGAWIAVEVKLNPTGAAVERAARSLLRLRSKVSRSRTGEPATLLVGPPPVPPTAAPTAFRWGQSRPWVRRRTRQCRFR